jgi:hypothetical protein
MSEGVLPPEAPAQPGDELKFDGFSLGPDGKTVEGVHPITGDKIVLQIPPKPGDDGASNPPLAGQNQN